MKKVDNVLCCSMVTNWLFSDFELIMLIIFFSFLSFLKCDIGRGVMYLISAGGEFDFPLICLKALDCELRELSILQLALFQNLQV